MLKKNALYKLISVGLLLVLLGIIFKYERKVKIVRDNNHKYIADLKEEYKLLVSRMVGLENVPALDALDESILQSGKDEMSKHKVVIVGITRDNIEESVSMINHIEYVGSFFKDYRVILFENDSIDGTKIQLEKWQKNNPKVRIVSEDYNNKKRPDIQFLADARNKYLDAIEDEEYEDFDMMMVIDMDMLYGVDIRGVSDSFSKIDQWDAVCSNGITRKGLIYDMFAFQNEEFPHSPDEWQRLCTSKAEIDSRWKKMCTNIELPPEGNGHYYWGVIVPQVQRNYPINSPLVSVYSCFGGMAFYKREFIKDCRYTTANNESEHVAFHKCLKEKHDGKMIMNPNQIIRYK